MKKSNLEIQEFLDCQQYQGFLFAQGLLFVHLVQLDQGFLVVREFQLYQYHLVGLSVQLVLEHQHCQMVLYHQLVQDYHGVQWVQKDQLVLQGQVHQSYLLNLVAQCPLSDQEYHLVLVTQCLPLAQLVLVIQNHPSHLDHLTILVHQEDPLLQLLQLLLVHLNFL